MIFLNIVVEGPTEETFVRDVIDPNLKAYDKVDYLEKAMATEINSERFIPYIQLHEFEALLFADIGKLKLFYLEGKDREIERLKAVASSFDSPELINEGSETAPSKQIIREIPEYYDNKVR